MENFISYFDILVKLVSVFASIAGILILINAVKRLRVTAITDLFHRFNDPDERTHRRKVYCLCKRLVNQSMDFSKLEKEDDNLSHIECVCNSLDWAGFLVKRNLLNKKDAIDLYGDSLIRSWVILRPWISVTREKRRSDRISLWSNFQWLQGEVAKIPRFVDWINAGVPIYTPDEIVTIDYETSSVIKTEPIKTSD